MPAKKAVMVLPPNAVSYKRQGWRAFSRAQLVRMRTSSRDKVFCRDIP